MKLTQEQDAAFQKVYAKYVAAIAEALTTEDTMRLGYAMGYKHAYQDLSSALDIPGRTVYKSRSYR